MGTDIVESVAIIGTGVMGTTVAWACTVKGLRTYLYDQSAAQTASAFSTVENWLLDGSLDEEVGRAALAHLRPCAALAEAVADVDLAFESVFEDLAVKQAIHAEIGRLAPERALQGSNASSLLCSPLAACSGRPDRFFNMNFTDPHAGEELVEVMWNPDTSEATKRAAIRWAETLGMVPVVCAKELVGHSFNRIWRAVKREALYVADIGAASPEDIDRAWMLLWGTPHGPFGLMDRIGLDTVQKIEMRYHDASGDERDRPPRILNELVATGHLGEKTGKGFYTWPSPAYLQQGWLRRQPPWREQGQAGGQ